MINYDEYYQHIYAPSPDTVSQPYESSVPVFSTGNGVTSKDTGYSYTASVNSTNKSSRQRIVTLGELYVLVLGYLLFSFVHVVIMFTGMIDYSTLPILNRVYDVLFIMIVYPAFLYLALFLLIWIVVGPIISKRYWMILGRLVILKCMVHVFGLNVLFL